MKTTKMLAVSVLVFGLAIGLASTAQAQPKYVIFLIGDGMGFEQVKAAGMYANGQTGTLLFESLPYKGELTTYSANSEITDSAAAATAMATGVKVSNGVISLAIPGDGSELETLLEYFKARHKSTGLVTTAQWFDATPAAFGAHVASRMDYGGIWNDYLDQSRPNVVLGGYTDPDVAAVTASAGYTIVTDHAAMQALDTETETMVFGQFGNGDMPYEYEGLGSLPHLSEMTATALSILDNDPDGFFLMIEGGRIDHACHVNDIQRAVLEAIEFDNTVQVAIDWAAGRSDTLILVTADHETGGLTVLANNGAGALPTVEWSSGNHTDSNVPVYGWGVNAELISAVMDNTEMFAVVVAGPEASNPDPQDGGTGVWLPPVLSWKPGIYATSHQVYFGTVFDDVNNATGAYPQADATYVPAGPLEVSTTYCWRVDEVNDLHPDSPWVGSVWTFTTAPGNSTQPDPANGTLAVAIDATLGWLPGPTAATHNVYFGTGSPPAFIGNQEAATYYPGLLEPGTTYYWQIDEIEADGMTIYTGDIWSFTTVPGSATQPDPANGGSVLALDTTLSWLPGPTAATHDVYFGTSSPLPFIGNQAESSFDPGPLEFGTTYYWQIDEVEADGTTVYTGDIWSFTPLFDVTAPGDTVQGVPNDGDWPPPEAPPLAIDDDTGTKYLHFKGDEGPSGFRVTASASQSIVTALTFTTANDYAGRDPVAFELSGSNEGIDGPYTLIASGDIVDFAQAAEWPRFTKNETPISFENEAAYDHYQVLFTAIRGGAGQWINSMQIAEVELLGITRKAWFPSPADGATEVGRNGLTLSWRTGVTAASHDVYLSTDRQAVIDGTAFIVNQIETSYSPEALTLTKGATYYWRIDGVEADSTTKHAGNVWSFTVSALGR